MVASTEHARSSLAMCIRATIGSVIGRRVSFHFHGELNDFLPPAKRNAEFEHLTGPTDTIKHVVESLGVPHTEFDCVTVNGDLRASSEQLSEGDRIHVFPYSAPIPLPNPRFVVDGHLGRLSAYLRMLGFDTWYDRFADDVLLASIASGEHRLLLTRDVGLLKRREVEHGYCVRSDKPHSQLREVSRRFALHGRIAPFQRCMDCNGSLRPVSKQEVEHLLPPHTCQTKNEFSRCTQCGKIYWRGSHHARMLGWIEDLAAGADHFPCPSEDL
jgi:uncharacterized protein with PIN domain